MSDYHILRKSQDSRNADVYVHLPVPATQTTAGAVLGDATLTFQRALSESLTGLQVTAIPLHDVQHATENAALIAGEVVEVFMSFRFDSLDLTNARRRTQIEDGNGNNDGVKQMKLDIADPASDLYNKILASLDWWGYHHNTT